MSQQYCPRDVNLKKQQLCKILRLKCDERGREKDSRATASIFNELGLLYRNKYPNQIDKISLIQHATLLKAAVIRQPNSEKFQNDFRDLCKHVLVYANAKNGKPDDLINVSDSAKMRVEELRKCVRYHLKAIENYRDEDNLETLKENTNKIRSYVNQIQLVQKHLSIYYKNIMAFVSQKCIEIMGTPPCKYAVVGMGSLARKEITPYSDFEHIIILENLDFDPNSSFKEYFRWYSTLFHIVIINLGETIIPSVCIPYLNDSSNRSTHYGDWFYDEVTTRGISFDGMMPHACKFPLGRTQKTKAKPWTTELIKPVDEMTLYLEENEDLKNGYKLGDILTRICFVEGEKTLYDAFFQKIKHSLNKLSKNSFLFLKQLDEDLHNFDIINNLAALESDQDINIKRIVYRSTSLFLSALGRLETVDANTGFEIIKELQKKQKINEITALRLSFAIAVSCHVRLFHYMDQKRQDDNISFDNAKSPAEKLQCLTKAVSINSLTKCLTTAFFLQLMLKIKVKLTDYDKTLENIEKWSHVRFLTLLGAHDEAIRYGGLCLENITKFEEKDINVLYQLVIAYRNSGKPEKSLCLFLNSKKLLREQQKRGTWPIFKFFKTNSIDPHYRMVNDYAFSRKVKQYLKKFSNFCIKVVFLLIFIFICYTVCHFCHSFF